MIKKIFINFSIIIVFVFLLITQACEDTISGEEIDNRTIPESNVSYAEHIQPVFDVKCNNSGCHDGTSSETDVVLVNWSTTRANPLVVFPGEPDQSSLVWAIEGRPPTPIMPPFDAGVTAMTQEQIRGVKTWIDEGAKNN